MQLLEAHKTESKKKRNSNETGQLNDKDKKYAFQGDSFFLRIALSSSFLPDKNETKQNHYHLDCFVFWCDKCPFWFGKENKNNSVAKPLTF